MWAFAGAAGATVPGAGGPICCETGSGPGTTPGAGAGTGGAGGGTGGTGGVAISVAGTANGGAVWNSANPFDAFTNQHVVPSPLVVVFTIAAIIQLFALNSIQPCSWLPCENRVSRDHTPGTVVSL